VIVGDALDDARFGQRRGQLLEHRVAILDGHVAVGDLLQGLVPHDFLRPMSASASIHIAASAAAPPSLAPPAIEQPPTT